MSAGDDDGAARHNGFACLVGFDHGLNGVAGRLLGSGGQLLAVLAVRDNKCLHEERSQSRILLIERQADAAGNVICHEIRVVSPDRGAHDLLQDAQAFLLECCPAGLRHIQDGLSCPPVRS